MDIFENVQIWEPEKSFKKQCFSRCDQDDLNYFFCVKKM